MSTFDSSLNERAVRRPGAEPPLAAPERDGAVRAESGLPPTVRMRRTGEVALQGDRSEPALLSALLALLPAHVTELCVKHGVTIEDFAPTQQDRNALRVALRLAKIDNVVLPSMSNGASGVSPEDLPVVMKQARELFEASFPPNEAEPWEVIAQRNADMHALADHDKRRAALSGKEARWDLRRLVSLVWPDKLAERYGDSSFHSLVVTKNNPGSFPRTCGYAQASSMPMKDGRSAVFAQYVTIPPGERGTGIFVVLSALANGIASLEGKINKREHVAIIGEAEFRGQADFDGIDFTHRRLGMHNHAGAKILMLRMSDGSWVSPHLQPRLAADKDPLKLHIVCRRAGADPAKRHVIESIPLPLVKDLVGGAFVDNFDREGFDAADVDDARTKIKEQLDRATSAVLVPAERIPDYAECARMDAALAEQISKDGSSIAEVRDSIDRALDRLSRRSERVDVMSPRQVRSASDLLVSQKMHRAMGDLRACFEPDDAHGRGSGVYVPIAATDLSGDHVSGLAIVQPSEGETTVVLCAERPELVPDLIKRALKTSAAQQTKQVAIETTGDPAIEAAVRSAFPDYVIQVFKSQFGKAFIVDVTSAGSDQS